ncbi:MAG: hypothetical protein WD645_07220 [Dehalococcoidia bacterium]
MSDLDQRIANAVEGTHVVRPPSQALATFGATIVRYYLVTEPLYQELAPRPEVEEAVVREGVVRAERPQVVTPYYLSRHEGFGENAGRYLRRLMARVGPDAPGLLYTYKNEGMETAIVAGSAGEVAARIAGRLDKEERGLEAVIRGSDDLWDVSLMKFIHDWTNDSARSNVKEMNARGLLHMESGVPREARVRIERMIEAARQGNVDPAAVHRELERWGVFEEYQDRFLGIFKGRL